MYDKILVAAGAAAVAVAAGAAVWWAYKKWKNGARDKVRAWIQAHPNARLRSVSLRLVDALDNAATQGEATVRYLLVGKTSTGEVEICQEHMSAEEVRQRGLSTDSGLEQEREVFSENELLALMTA